MLSNPKLFQLSLFNAYALVLPKCKPAGFCVFTRSSYNCGKGKRESYQRKKNERHNVKNLTERDHNRVKRENYSWE